MLGDFASLDVQNTYRGSDAYVQKEPGHQGGRDRLDEIADEHAFDFEFD
ncbi:hypothetical protein [Piscirickettsia salmonis]|nr:hypothetical protein [Piscirickettsia salmonis]